MKIPSNTDLRKTFSFIRESHYLGVPGVWVVDSRRDGPTVGITIHTHGNEPAGMAVLCYLRSFFRLKQKIVRGKVIFVVNNLKASERFYRARTPEEKKLCRLVDLNMNRLPVTCMKIHRRKLEYEILRAQELRQVWKEFDAGLDIHSTSQECAPMIINCGICNRDLLHRIPIEIVISEIEKIQTGKPAALFYGRKKIQVLGIEAGSHEAAGSYRKAIDCALEFLAYFGLVALIKSANRPSEADSDQRVYRVFDSVWFPNSSYKLAKVFKPFGNVKIGQFVASGNKGKIYCPKNCVTIFAPRTREVSNLNEEVLFYAEREE